MNIITEYQRAMQRRAYSPGTIDARSALVRRWLRFAGEEWPTATPERFEDWLDAGGPIVARTRYGRISHLHQFYRWALRHGYATTDPTELLERPRLPRGLPRPARMVDVDLAIAEAEPVMARMLSLMVDGGLRCCEVARLDWQDVDLDLGVLYLTGKGATDRTVGVPRRLEQILAGADEVVGPVVGRRMTPTRVSQLVGAHLRSCGISTTAHKLRHLYATRMLAATGDITIVQQALGHASIATTQIYAQVDPMRVLAAARAL